MNAQQKVKFATQADPQLLKTMRSMAKTEGRQFQTLINEALQEYVDRKQNRLPRPHVMQALDESLLKYNDLYRELAK